jgi:hypothetical protein
VDVTWTAGAWERVLKKKVLKEIFPRVTVRCTIKGVVSLYLAVSHTKFDHIGFS